MYYHIIFIESTTIKINYLRLWKWQTLVLINIFSNPFQNKGKDLFIWLVSSDCCMINLRPSHTTKNFTTIFPKKLLWKLLPIYKTVEKIFAVVKKSCSVYGR